MRSDSEVTHAIVRSVAEGTGADLDELPPLYDVVDPDALETLLDGDERVPISVRFTYAGHRVRIDAAEDGIVAVESTASDGSSDGECGSSPSVSGPELRRPARGRPARDGGADGKRGDRAGQSSPDS